MARVRPCAQSFGLGLGIAGAFAARTGAEEAYDVATGAGSLLSNPARLIETTTLMFGSKEDIRNYYELREIETGEPSPFDF